MVRTYALAALIAASLAVHAPAFASEQSDPGDVLGSWTFQTDTYRQGTCSMSGIMRLMPDPEEGVYACELTAVEECSFVGRSVVVQSCTARRFGNQVSVRSIIEQMIETDFEGINYVPDNFALTIQSPQRMYGALVSAVTAPVEFHRSEEGVS